ncbi:hypothetical protein H4R19_000278 [Coemansia spiralis]|nr:hypothetical protein H4R19_000278 [Coemansia spiralis]
MSNDGRGFFLFGALNGLIERARSSAEKESQRLFTVSEASAPADNNGPQQQQLSASRKRKSAPLASARHSSRPPHRHESLVAAMHERRSHARSRLPQQQPLPPSRAPSVVSERTRLAATVGELGLEGNALDDARVRRQPGVHAWLSGHPMLGGAPEPGHAAEGEAEENETAPSEAHSTTSKRKWTEPATSLQSRSRSRQPRSPPGYAAKKTRLGDARQRPPSETGCSPPHSNASSPVLPRVHAASTRSSMTAVSAAVEPGVSAATQTPQAHGSGARTERQRAASPDPLGEASSAVGRARLEKVERELHHLKKIIASLLPGELNDDDLRSVYGDLDRPQRASEDVITRLIKERFGALLPPLPTITAGAVADGPSSSVRGLRGAIPAPPPLPPPSSQLLSAVNTLASARGPQRSARPVRVSSLSSPQPHLPRRGSSDSAASVLSGGRPAVPAMVVQRLRAELRPAAKTAAPPPPHKDPGVMSKLLDEMKHHKLRTVTKPKDMGCS